MTDIRNGVNAGKTVTVHDTQITLNGWSGTGYIILDPNTGAGAYMIGGGLDGGSTLLKDNNLAWFLMGMLTGAVASAGAAMMLSGSILLGVLALATAWLVSTMLTNLLLEYSIESDATCFKFGLYLGIPIGFAIAKNTLTPIILLTIGWLLTSLTPLNNFNPLYDCVS